MNRMHEGENVRRLRELTEHRRRNQIVRVVARIIPGNVAMTQYGNLRFIPDYPGVRDLLLTLTNLALIGWLIREVRR